MTTTPSTWSQPLQPASVAAALVGARRAGRTLHVPLTDEIPLSMPEAYAIQREVTAIRLAAGERPIGWKLGYTSAAMREQMGVTSPNFGPLTDAMALTGSDTELPEVPPGALQPRAEPEIGLLLGDRVPAGSDIGQVLAACAGAYACVEVVDSVWAGYRFRIEDNTADGSSAAWFVRGPSLPLDDLAAVEVEILSDGALVASATGAAASGHPAAGVAWLADRLAATGRSLDAGSFIITGGLTAAIPLGPGAIVSARFAPVGDAVRTVSVTRVGLAP